jgi:hypothetical protein
MNELREEITALSLVLSSLCAYKESSLTDKHPELDRAAEKVSNTLIKRILEN